MRFAIAPYDLSHRSEALCAALLLADEGGVGTLVPVHEATNQSEDPDHQRPANVGCPWCARFLDSWRWAGPLWRSGLLVNLTASRGLASRLGAHAQALRASPTTSGLAELLGETPDEAAWCRALCKDLAESGRNAALRVLILRALEDLAAEADACLVGGYEPQGPKLRTRHETLTRFTLLVPRFRQGDDVLRLRELASAELDDLRNCAEVGGPRTQEAADAVNRALAQVLKADHAGSATMMMLTFRAGAAGSVLHEVERRVARLTAGGVATGGASGAGGASGGTSGGAVPGRAAAAGVLSRRYIAMDIRSSVWDPPRG